MSAGNAWLLECSDSLTVAVGDHEIVECVQPERAYAVPTTPGYCHHVIPWQGRLVPVLDMAEAFQAGTRHESRYVCLLSYQEAPLQPLRYIGVPVSRTPRKIEVSDEQVCEASEEAVPALLQAISLCCFTHDELPVPIVDIARLASGEFREMALAS